MIEKKCVLITGANKGIGYETARKLGAKGYRVWLGVRELQRGAVAAEKLNAEGIDTNVVQLDVTDEISVRTAAERIAESEGKLDVLINNAGISGSQRMTPEEQPLTDVAAIYETNVFGPIRVTQAFIPLLKKAGRANVVMVSSGLGSLGWLSDPGNSYYKVNLLGYNSSKTALNAVTLSFAKHLAESGIKVNAADPGYTATEFNGHSGYRTVDQAAESVIWLATIDGDGPSGGFYFDGEPVPW